MKQFLLLVIAALGLIAPERPAFAAVPNNDFIFLFNRLPGEPLARKYSLGTVMSEAHTRAICVYDSTYGVAIGNVTLRNTDGLTPCILPAKSVVLNIGVDVTTAVTSAGSATVAVQTVGGSANLVTATAKASLGANTRLLGTPVFATASTWIKNGANDIGVQAVIATAALTAGHFRVFIDYGRSE
jgi:hypothetical protein